MSSETKTKVCWSCEGRLSDEDQRCIYCGADQKILAPTKEEFDNSPYKLVSPEETEKPIPIPIYKPQDTEISLKDPLQEQMQSILEKKEAPEPKEETPQIQQAVQELQVEQKPKTKHEKQKGQLASLILAMGGSTFFLFALALSLFSRDGLLTISWNSHWWPLYMCASLPMLFFSWRFMRKLED